MEEEMENLINYLEKINNELDKLIALSTEITKLDVNIDNFHKTE